MKLGLEIMPVIPALRRLRHRTGVQGQPGLHNEIVSQKSKEIIERNEVVNCAATEARHTRPQSAGSLYCTGNVQNR
jgi:hypothetical protein